MPSPTDPILLQFGPLVVRWYGLLIVTGAIFAAYIASIEAQRKKEDPDHAWNLLVWCLIAGILGARLYHVLSTPAGNSRGFYYYFIEQPFAPISVFGLNMPFPTALMIWQGGLGIYGGLLGGILAMVVYTQRHHLVIWRWLDIYGPGMLLAQAIGRWGNYFNQELYGPPTMLPWGIKITNLAQRVPPYDDLNIYPLSTTFHPVFLYESLWNVLGFVVLMWIGRKYTKKLFDGDIASLYLIWYPLGRIFVEMLRPDAWTLNGIPTAQIVGGVLLVIGVGLVVYRHRHPESATNPQTHQTILPQRRRPAKKGGK